MMISKLFVCFIFYSFLGWIWETCYCTIKDHYWQNRGFLYGPCVPIYGCGGIFAYIAFFLLPFDHMKTAPVWEIFLICMIGSIFMEYITSYVLEKLFHARWWDYSDIPLNVNGRVCFPVSLAFGVAGIVVVKYIVPYTVSFPIFDYPVLIEFLSLLLMFVFGMDMALTISALTTFAKRFEMLNEQFNETMTAKYASLESNVADAKETLNSNVTGAKEALVDNVNVAKEALVDNVNGAKEALVDNVNGAKEVLADKLSTEALTKFMSTLSRTERLQLSHITKFTHPVNSTKNLMEKGALILKEKRHSRKNNKQLEG